MRTVRLFAFMQRPREFRERPAADAGLLVRSDVRSVEGTEGCLQRAAAGIRRRVLALFGVAAEAAGCFRQVFTALCVALGERSTRGEQKEKPRRSGASHEAQQLLFLAEVVV